MRNYFVVFKVFIHKDSQLAQELTMNYAIQREQPILNLDDIRDVETELTKIVKEMYSDLDCSCVLTNWRLFE